MPSASTKGVYRAIKPALTRHRAGLGPRRRKCSAHPGTLYHSEAQPLRRAHKGCVRKRWELLAPATSWNNEISTQPLSLTSFDCNQEGWNERSAQRFETPRSQRQKRSSRRKRPQGLLLATVGIHENVWVYVLVCTVYSFRTCSNQCVSAVSESDLRSAPDASELP